MAPVVAENVKNQETLSKLKGDGKKKKKKYGRVEKKRYVNRSEAKIGWHVRRRRLKLFEGKIDEIKGEVVLSSPRPSMFLL